MTAAQPGLTLVCGGGGLWGAAWMTGLVAGLQHAAVDIRGAETLIGTSAGATVCTQLASRLSIDDLYARQADPARQLPLLAPPAGALEAVMGVMQREWKSEDDRLEAICALARRAPPLDPAVRREQVEKRLGPPSPEWPARRLLITALSLETRELAVFSRDSGVSLVDAVSASGAVPGVWPVTTIAGVDYVDGGVWRTAENAHLAAGSPRVVILAPMGNVGGGSSGAESGLERDVATLRAQGSAVIVIAADGDALAAMAPNPLDPVTRKPAAEAGLAQGATVADALRGFL